MSICLKNKNIGDKDKQQEEKKPDKERKDLLFEYISLGLAWNC